MSVFPLSGTVNSSRARTVQLIFFGLALLTNYRFLINTTCNKDGWKEAGQESADYELGIKTRII